MLIKLLTNKDVNTVSEALQKAVTDNGFGVMQIHDLKESMLKKGVEFDRECLIFEVCNPHQAKKVLEGDMGVSTALPCRISLYTENGKTILATIKPTMMLSMFNLPQLSEVAQNVELIMQKIMQDAIAD